MDQFNLECDSQKLMLAIARAIGINEMPCRKMRITLDVGECPVVEIDRFISVDEAGALRDVFQDPEVNAVPASDNWGNYVKRMQEHVRQMEHTTGPIKNPYVTRDEFESLEKRMLGLMGGLVNRIGALEQSTQLFRSTNPDSKRMDSRILQMQNQINALENRIRVLEQPRTIPPIGSPYPAQPVEWPL